MILRVFAMARPGRPPAEFGAVARAAERLIADGAAPVARSLGQAIAERVVASIMDELDTPRDSFAHGLGELAQLLERCPFVELATCPHIDAAAVIRAERLARFEARGTRHLPESEWTAERRDIARTAQGKLGKRYARALEDYFRICP